MLEIKDAVKRYRCVPAVTGVAFVAMTFPVFAEGTTPATGLDSLLATFPVVTAWFWKEYRLLLTRTLSQPILLVAMCLFFAGAVVAFFMRTYHQV